MKENMVLIRNRGSLKFVQFPAGKIYESFHLHDATRFKDYTEAYNKMEKQKMHLDEYEIVDITIQSVEVRWDHLSKSEQDMMSVLVRGQ